VTDLATALAQLRAIDSNRRYNAKDFWKPYPKQLEFFKLGKTKTERLLMAGNRLGKTMAGAYETACHLTGLYPDWWEGRRWNCPVKAWAAGVSTTAVRDVSQFQLCGPPEVEDEFGTGFIPRDCFLGRPTLARGAVSGAFDTARVRHFTDGVEDGISTLQFKSYEQGRMKFQGASLDFCWPDEEPPLDIYTEMCTRFAATRGMSFMTFTPLLGMSDVVVRFLNEPSNDRAVVQMGIKDAAHMTPEMVEELLARYPIHEREARMNGEPLLGSGRVFQTDVEKIKFPIDQIIPAHWVLIWGIDFGISHPFAAVLCAWDRDEDTVYVLATYRAADELPLVHSEAIRRVCSEAPVAWPHDGHRRDPGSGAQLASLYKKLDLRMLPTHAHFTKGGFSTEAAVLDMQQRFQSGRLRVREDLGDFFEEYRMYHRKDGLLVKVRDDLLSATMKALMMLRYARPAPMGKKPQGFAVRNRPTQARPMNPWTGVPV
jgi:phage terminase large subunit-like protein